ncbi:S8 family serine peptidase [Streptomyces misionensis]|uniref:S8 family serine peptidase n=1 Tax=Streptomyces misionensis TaxID=67331 RepID=UPI0036757863
MALRLLRRTGRAGRFAQILAVTVALGASTGQAAAATPSPSPSASELRLPVMPARLDGTAPTCTQGSGTTMTQVPWAQRLLGLSRAGLFTDGSGITVGVVDTGVSTRADVLSGRVTVQSGAGSDCVGHGTFVAGLIAAAPQSGIGFTGAAPGVRIFAARGTDAIGDPDASTAARGIRAAVDAGCRVVTVSVALPRNTPALASAVRYAAAHDVLLVAPAVPDGTDNGQQQTAAPVSFWPAAERSVLSVVDFGADGSRPDGAFQPADVDLAAPGDQVSSIGPTGHGYFVGSGPSFAAAYVAGAAALVRAYHPQLTAEQTAERLRRTGYPGDVPRLDVNSAITGVLPARVPTAGPSSAGFRALPAAHDGGVVRSAVSVAAGAAGLALVLGAAAAARRRRDQGGRGRGVGASAA